MKPKIIIADDVTGAGDSGVHFAAAGLRTALLLDKAALPKAAAEHQSVALSTESRFLPPREAAAAAARMTAAALEAGGMAAFKKIDSTLRGNPGAEIEAVMDTAGFQAALVCSAMPKTGRTCRDGVLLVDDVPLHETGLGRDPFNPVKTGRVSAILAEQSGIRSGTLGLAEVRSGTDRLRRTVMDLIAGGARFVIADAVNDDDMLALGELLRLLRTTLLPAGAGGLAEAFAGAPVLGSFTPPPERMLLVAGSLTAETREQVERAREDGRFFLLELDMTAALADADGEIARLLARAAEAGKRHVLLTNLTRPEKGTRLDAGVAEQAAGLFARAAGALCRAEKCGLVYATGGATAVAAAGELGFGSITLSRELMPGVVLSECFAEGCPARWFVSKAGGFGRPDTLTRLADFCSYDTGAT